MLQPIVSTLVRVGSQLINDNFIISIEYVKLTHKIVIHFTNFGNGYSLYSTSVSATFEQYLEFLKQFKDLIS